MTFSREMKAELANANYEKGCCILAETSGFIKTAGRVSLADSGMTELKLSTENGNVARHFKSSFNDNFEIKAKIAVSDNPFKKEKKIYELIVEDQEAEKLLRKTGILKTENGLNFFPGEIPEDILTSKCCKRAYLKGAFMGSGSISNPHRGYHLEIVSDSESLATSISQLINSMGFSSKIGKRKNNWIVYLKEGEQVSDFLALIGAHTCVMDFENIRIVRELRNKTNRIVNCENANLDKIIESAGRQMEHIKIIDAEIGINSLSPKLREVANLRLTYPEASLAELAAMTNPPIKKSGLNHRFKKIEKIAGNIHMEK